MKRKQILAFASLALMLAMGATVARAATQTVIIRVEGMTCDGCAITVEEALKKTGESSQRT